MFIQEELKVWENLLHCSVMASCPEGIYVKLHADLGSVPRKMDNFILG